MNEPQGADIGTSRITAGDMNKQRYSAPMVTAPFKPHAIIKQSSTKHRLIAAINNGDPFEYGKTADEHTMEGDLSFDRSGINSFTNRISHGVVYFGTVIRADCDKANFVITAMIKDMPRLNHDLDPFRRNLSLTYFRENGDILYKVKFKEIKFHVTIQGHASFMVYCSKNPNFSPKGKYIAIIDIGSRTLNIIKVKDNHIILDSSSTTEDGTKQLLKDWSSVLQYKGHEKNIYELEKHLISGKGRMQFLNGDVIEDSEILPPILNRYFKRLENSINAQIGDDSPELILITGGGSILLRKYRPDFFKTTTYFMPNPLTSNFEGVQLYMRSKFGVKP